MTRWQYDVCLLNKIPIYSFGRNYLNAHAFPPGSIFNIKNNKYIVKDISINRPQTIVYLYVEEVLPKYQKPLKEPKQEEPIKQEDIFKENSNVTWNLF